MRLWQIGYDTEFVRHTQIAAAWTSCCKDQQSRPRPMVISISTPPVPSSFVFLWHFHSSNHQAGPAYSRHALCYRWYFLLFAAAACRTGLRVQHRCSDNCKKGQATANDQTTQLDVPSSGISPNYATQVHCQFQEACLCPLQDQRRHKRPPASDSATCEASRSTYNRPQQAPIKVTMRSIRVGYVNHFLIVTQAQD